MSTAFRSLLWIQGLYHYDEVMHAMGGLEAGLEVFSWLVDC